jgi:hypothetical protein
MIKAVDAIPSNGAIIARRFSEAGRQAVQAAARISIRIAVATAIGILVIAISASRIYTDYESLENDC